ncbi:hypothetical protein GCM10018952_29030 [Streptosporangium vulgare]
MHEYVNIRYAVRQERISDIEDPPGDVGNITTLLVDGHDPAEIRRRGDLREEGTAYARGGAGDGDDGGPGAFRGRHQVLTLH